MKISADVRLAAAMVAGLISYLMIENSDLSTKAVKLFSYFANQHSEPSVKTVVARYVEQLKLIGTMPDTLHRSQEPASRLALTKTRIETIETIARAIEQALATTADACEFAEAAGDRIESEIPAAVGATDNLLKRLLVETDGRYHSLITENMALGWVGWRGSREQDIQELALLSHEVSIASDKAHLAFDRLRAEASALDKVASTCGTAGGTSAEHGVG